PRVRDGSRAGPWGGVLLRRLHPPRGARPGDRRRRAVLHFPQPAGRGIPTSVLLRPRRQPGRVESRPAPAAADAKALVYTPLPADAPRDWETRPRALHVPGSRDPAGRPGYGIRRTGLGDEHEGGGDGIPR